VPKNNAASAHRLISLGGFFISGYLNLLN
jgi:hypothetical protein